jgi:tetratricopeptide (TPR) repeat protein
MVASAIEKLVNKMDDLYQSELFDQAITMANHVLRTYPDSLDTHLIRGTSFMKKKLYKKAISDFSFVLQCEPDSMHAKLGRSICYMKLNKMDRMLAREVIDDAIKKHPEDSNLFYYRAMINYHNGELMEAVEDYSSAIRAASEPLENYYLNRGELYLKLRRYNEAIEDFSEALKSSPCEYNQPYLFFNRAKAYVEKGESEKAALDIRRAIRLNPEEEDFQRLASRIIPGWHLPLE